MNDRPRASRFRLSLRALMAIVLVAGATSGWRANRARTQRRAVEAVKALNGSVVYDFQYTGDDGPAPPFGAKEPAAPKWLRTALGDEYFQEVTMVVTPPTVPADILPAIAKFDRLVHLNLGETTGPGGGPDDLARLLGALPGLKQLGLTGPKVDDSTLALIVARLPRLQALVLSRTSATGAGMAHLAGARDLRRIAIHGAAGVTDAGMAGLAGLPDLRRVELFEAPGVTDLGLKNLGPALARLEMLILFHSSVTDAGLASLEASRNLKILSLDGAKVGDPGLAHLRSLDSLETLILNATGVTDSGLKSLRGLKALQTLSLVRTKVAGPGLDHLEGLANLSTLLLNDTPTTDAGLGPIRKLTGLTTLALRGTQVSPAAVAASRAARPSLRIMSGPVPPMSPRPAPPPK